MTTAAPMRPRAARASARIVSAIERDAQRLQLRLPFPDEKTIDMARCCAILHVSPHVVRRLMATPLKNIVTVSQSGADPEAMCIDGYNTMQRAPMRIEYDSLVRFLDLLREKHGILDRRGPIVFGRRRDDDLLPFPWADTITVTDASEALAVHISKVLLRIESGLFEAYQIAPNSPWRISRQSFSSYLDNVSRIPRNERPYGG